MTQSALAIRESHVNTFKCSAMITLTALLCCQVFAADAKETAAAKFSADWLALLDAGKYDQCWKQTSPSFQSSIRKDKWESQLGHSRHLLGKIRGRKLLNAVYTSKLAGAQEGEYVVVTFLAGYERLGSGIETVIPQLQPDGTWKISGYGVKPSDVDDSGFPALPN
jgi:Protein of unknown function (DUF4019)